MKKKRLTPRERNLKKAKALIKLLPLDHEQRKGSFISMCNQTDEVIEHWVNETNEAFKKLRAFNKKFAKLRVDIEKKNVRS